MLDYCQGCERFFTECKKHQRQLDCDVCGGTFCSAACKKKNATMEEIKASNGNTEGSHLHARLCRAISPFPPVVDSAVQILNPKSSASPSAPQANQEAAAPGDADMNWLIRPPRLPSAIAAEAVANSQGHVWAMIIPQAFPENRAYPRPIPSGSYADFEKFLVGDEGGGEKTSFFSLAKTMQDLVFLPVPPADGDFVEEYLGLSS